MKKRLNWLMLLLAFSPLLSAQDDSAAFRDEMKIQEKGPELIEIPAGEFRMGDLQEQGKPNEQPVKTVTVNAFAMGKYEVTFDEYEIFSRALGREMPPSESWGQGQRPVINVSWMDAQLYTDWLSEQTGHTYRLPTEIEWEYAARAGTETVRYWGDDPRQACEYANVYDESGKQQTKLPWDAHDCQDNFTETAPVGQFKPNAFGLYDMLGNVWEWTCSIYTPAYTDKAGQCLNRRMLKKGSKLTLRGGSWGVPPKQVRAAVRFYNTPIYRVGNLGFRVVRELAAAPATNN